MSSLSKDKKEESLLSFSTLLRGTRNPDANIRGNSIRGFGNTMMNVNVTEILPEIEEGMRDNNAYVRRCTITTLHKLCRQRPQLMTGGPKQIILFS